MQVFKCEGRPEEPPVDPKTQIVQEALNQYAPSPCVVVLDITTCRNGIVQKGTQVIDAGQKCTVVKMFYDSSKKKAMCELTRCDDDDTVVITPARKLILDVDNPNNWTLPYVNLENIHPIKAIFTLLAAVRSAIDMSFGKTNAFWSADLCPSSPVARAVLGFRTSETKNSVSLPLQNIDTFKTLFCHDGSDFFYIGSTFFLLQVIYSIAPTKQQIANETLDHFLGENWDLLPARGAEESDYIVKCMKFSEVSCLLTKTIRIKIKGTTGNYASDPYYRELVASNSQSYDLYIE